MKDIFDNLRDNITSSYLFYVPLNVYEMIQDSGLKDIIPMEATDVILYIDSKKRSTVNPKEFNRIEIVAKSAVLDENSFQLFNEQRNLPESEFQFLLNKYYEHLNAHHYITQSLCHSLTKWFPDVEEDIKQLFTLQAQIFEKHYKNIIQNFNIGKEAGAFKTNSIISRFENSYSNSKELNIKVPTFETPENDSSQLRPQRKKKPILITDDEAEIFILESVFNIDRTCSN
jgi:hypothetical protein